MREHPAAAGPIIYLNGASSAGKTSIGRALQRVLDEPHLLLGIDSFIQMMPHDLFGHEDGWQFIPAGDGAMRVRLGPVAERALGAMYEAAAALSRSGNRVIFDDVMTSPEMLRRLVEAWAGLDVLLVGVRCPVDVAEARERARGDRVPGLARGSSARAHELVTYDVEVDSGAMTPRACAEAIAGFLRTQPLRAFARLRSGVTPS